MNNKINQKIALILFDIFLLSFAFLFVAWLKPATRRVVLPHYGAPFLIFVIFWFLISFLIDKFNLKGKKSYYDILVPIIRGDFAVLALVSLLIAGFHITGYSRLILFGTILLSFVLEIFWATIYYLYKKYGLDKDINPNSIFVTHSSKIENSYEKEIEQEEDSIEKILKNQNKREIDTTQTIYLKLKESYLKGKKSLFDFVEENIDLSKISRINSLILDTDKLYNIENWEPGSQELFINLHTINDFRRINKCFIAVNKNLKYGGYFVGCGETVDEHNKRFFYKYPRFIGYPLFVGDFIFNRVFPKLPVFKEIYFGITRGKKRVLSRCELLGRLSYSGFNIVSYKEINNKLYFIGMKIKEPSNDPNPSYGPLIRLKRVSKDGEYIHVYKMRTMHPYAEYLHRYMIQKHGYNENGKIKEDFRVTSWAKFIRKFYLDEIPQLINFLRGELSLVGVRPVSDVYLREYPEELRLERSHFKPGCIPPYVALKMPGKEGCIESERIYMEEKKNYPIWTDIKFFTLSVFNILTRQVHSK